MATVKTRTVTVNLPKGLHSRPATIFTQKANEFQSSIWLEKNDRRASAKSLLGVLSLGVRKGEEIDILADGEDQDEAINALVRIVQTTAGEDIYN